MFQVISSLMLLRGTCHHVQVHCLVIVQAVCGTVGLPQGLNTLLRPSLLDSPLSPLTPLGRQQSFLDELLSSGRERGHSVHGYTNIMTLLRSQPKFSVLVKALELTDLASSLEDGGPFTIFAPTNFAFDSFGREKMLSDVDSLRRVLLRHITRHKLPSLSIPAGVSQVDLANNEKVSVSVATYFLTIVFSSQSCPSTGGWQSTALKAPPRSSPLIYMLLMELCIPSTPSFDVI